MDLEVGKIRTSVEAEKTIKRGARRGSGKNSGGRKNRGGGGGGNDGGDNSGDGNDFNFEQIEKSERSKFRVGMWFALLVVTMTFGGLISAYIAIAANGALEWKPFNLPAQIWISTFLILASSLTYEMSGKKLNADYQSKAKTWLLTTVVLGACFISSQILAWLALVRQGVYMASNQYAGFFYFLTGVHALHVFGGILALGFIVLRTWTPTESDRELLVRKNFFQVVGWYWHFMGALWVVLFLLLGFWK